jgi:hypothetical protein
MSGAVNLRSKRTTSTKTCGRAGEVCAYANS